MTATNSLPIADSGTPSPEVDILILGAGWTATFLVPLCNDRGVTTASTTRTGRNGSLTFVFDPAKVDLAQFEALPKARTVLITFPIILKGAATHLVKLYKSTHPTVECPRFIQLGSTSIWDGTRNKPAAPVENKWYDRHTPHTPGHARAEAEDELLSLNPETPTTILNLSGLWGGERNARNWLSRIATSKEALRLKGSLHLLHGLDLARAILAVHTSFSLAAGSRWLLTDGRIYDWWDLASAWGATQGGPQPAWVRELLREGGVRALPRNVEVLGRALDSREFWGVFKISPVKARIETEQ